MNKTLSVNIGGIVFHIEEQAYDRLNRYLETIKSYFTSSDGRDEIIQDIEGRLGEMFQERLTMGKQVIVDADVEQVINLMGRPEQFVDAGEEPVMNESTSAHRERRTNRRLYRDPDDRVIGGVCSGFGHYLGVDAIWLRLAFAIALIAFGSGLLLYIILMIIMPKAETTAEKLEMKGEKVNLSNIKKSVEDEMSAIKSNYEGSKAKSGVANFFDALGDFILGALRLLGKIIAAFFLVIGVIILIAFGMTFLALIGIGSVSIPFAITDVVLESWQQTFSAIGVFLLIGIPVILIIYHAIRVLFKIKTDTKALNWSALALWIVGLIMSIVVASSIAGEFRSRESDRVSVPITQPAGDTLHLALTNNYDNKYDWYFGKNQSVQTPWSSNIEMDSIRIEKVQLDIIKSTSDSFELVQIISSRGNSRKTAYENTQKISYEIDQQGDLIKFDESFILPKGSKYRGQKIQLLMKVPVGKSIFLSDDMGDFIYDVKNVTNTFDGHMVGKTWTMTDQGLECIGCGLEERRTRRKSNDLNIRINDGGVKIRGVDVDADSSFTIHGDDVKISIDDEGVEINTRKK